MITSRAHTIFKYTHTHTHKYSILFFQILVIYHNKTVSATEFSSPNKIYYGLKEIPNKKAEDSRQK